MEADAVYLSFSVGAINGYAHIGVLRTLEDEYARRGKDLHRCIRGAAGASAGAMMALATVLGYRAAELKRFADEQLDAVASELQRPNLVHLYRTGTGMLKPEPIRRVVRAMLERKLGVPDLTFAELARRMPGVEVWFHAHNTDDLRGEALSAATHPTMSVAEACTASCMMPVIFESLEVDGTMYVDGGISDSLPFQMFDPDKTIKVYLRKVPPPRYLRKIKPLSFLQHLSRVVEAFETSTRVRLEHDPAPHNLISIALPLESIANIVDNTDARDRLYHHGRLIALLWANPQYVDGIAALLDMAPVIEFGDVEAMLQHASLVDTVFVGEVEHESEEDLYDDFKRMLGIQVRGWSITARAKTPYLMQVRWDPKVPDAPKEDPTAQPCTTPT